MKTSKTFFTQSDKLRFTKSVLFRALFSYLFIICPTLSYFTSSGKLYLRNNHEVCLTCHLQVRCSEYYLQGSKGRLYQSRNSNCDTGEMFAMLYISQALTTVLSIRLMKRGQPPSFL